MGWAYVRSGKATMQLWLAGEETHDHLALRLRSVMYRSSGVGPAASQVPGGEG